MKRKCKYCDSVGERSIDTSKDDYLYIKNYYCHTNCYKIYLKTKKKMCDSLIESEILFIKNKMKKDKQDRQDKQDFLQYIIKYYNISLSNWQYIKIGKVHNGTYNQKMKEGISYCDLLEMWTNPKFLKKIEKIAYKNNITKNSRFDYDLGIVVGEYDKYKKAKIKKQIDNSYIKDMIKKKNITKKSINKLNKTKDNEEDIDIFEMLD